MPEALFIQPVLEYEIVFVQSMAAIVVHMVSPEGVFTSYLFLNISSLSLIDCYKSYLLIAIMDNGDREDKK